MAVDTQTSELFQGFSKLNRKERLIRLVEMGALTKEDVSFLSKKNAIDPELAEKFIENVIGYFHMPLGVATNFHINGRDYVIPMAVEETSIIAAASKTARWISKNGSITTSSNGQLLIGQIQLAKVKNPSDFRQKFESHKKEFIKNANEHVAHGLVNRGGGVMDIQLREIIRPDQQTMMVLHVLTNTCDAMGANIINQVCEYLKEPIEQLTGETVTMCILSNLADQKLTKAQIILENIDPQLGNKLTEASLFAEIDPYRATTNNKGVLNGMDSVLVATGNDWRAVEAGVHAYAARSGKYSSITKWQMDGKHLIGTLEAPIIVGIVGGVTKLHPTAQMCLRMLHVQNAQELSEIIAAVGLVQNLGAIRALTTVGIIEGHMKLHISNLVLSAGATEQEVPIVEDRLREILKSTRRVSLQQAVEVLEDIRDHNL